MNHPTAAAPVRWPAAWCEDPTLRALAAACGITLQADAEIAQPHIGTVRLEAPVLADDGRCLRLDTPQARGRLWLSTPVQPDAVGQRVVAAAHSAALARGYVEADAGVIAAMALQAVARGADALTFMQQADTLPMLDGHDDVEPPAPHPAPPFGPGLYALADDAARVDPILARASDDLCALQLRIKREAHAGLDDAAFEAHVRAQATQAADALLAHRAARHVVLVINDHWRVAGQLITAWRDDPRRSAVRIGVHLGQEDLAALGRVGRAELMAMLQADPQRPVALGLSSHSLWELARARAMGPAVIACGPVWPTLTKAMPWRPQGLDNLAWWSAMAGVPVVAIGGILSPEQLRSAAAAGAPVACLVRALSDEGLAQWSAWQDAWRDGRRAAAGKGHAAIGWPHPSLPGPFDEAAAAAATPRRKATPADPNKFRVENRPSAIDGTGAFAGEDIPAYKKIGEIRGEAISVREARQRVKGQARIMMVEISDRRAIDATHSSDPLRYTNHACQPNTVLRIRGGRVELYAMRAIKAGEELTADYGETHHEGKLVCRCGLPNCRGSL
ncbi:thiamine phosphate synthase [Leptothrix discophora]|uniref:Thiamine phosphate synthase n=1 Tax=Leptothrix discophora TaxID=89 RepID=A0ABT9FY72_LEPDI|nr:thiamine phosphate synthase [Leptothrix discophora]MDP4299197.1 thiamine phosphate synthase [Leptothrix discophora]